MQYADFIDTFQLRLNRDDCTDSMASYFIAGGQNRLSRVLRVPSMLSELIATPSATTIIDPISQQPFSGLFICQVPIPSDFLMVKSVLADGIVLSPTSYAEIARMPIFIGYPHKFRIEGAQMYIKPFAQYSVQLLYYAQFPALVNPTDTNFLLVGAIEALMFASLSYAGDHFRLDDTPTWAGRMQDEVTALNQQALDTEIGGGSMQMLPVYGSDSGGDW